MIRDIDSMIQEIDNIEKENYSLMKLKSKLEESILKLQEENRKNSEAYNICINAIEILRNVSDDSVRNAYKFLEEQLNSALERMFEKSIRKIRIKEYTLKNQYPQLELELEVGNGRVRSLKSDSGHGLAQIVSLLCVLCLIVLTNGRRILVLDEVMSGLSARNREIVTEILWSFTEIGFQFIINEHGYIPRGANVYHLEMIGDVSGVKYNYIEEDGVNIASVEKA
ncbi:MAG: hypothetical protein QXD03_03845 [Candidatus Anstonellales archaeon]